MGDAERQLVRIDSRGALPSAHSNVFDEPPDAALSGSLLDYWAIIRRRQGLVAALALAGTVLGILLTVVQTPVYRSRVTLEMQSLAEDDLVKLRDASSAVIEPPQPPELDLNTQVKLLQSRELVERAAGKVCSVPRPESTGGPGPARRRLLSVRRPVPPPLQAEVVESAPSALRVRVLPNTRIIEIVYDSENAQFSADFVNAIAEEFIKQKLESRWQSSRHIRDWLSGQMHDLKMKLEQSESELQRFSRNSGLLFTSETENVSEQRLKQVQQELVRAQADRILKESKLEAATSAAPESLPQVLEHRTLQEYQEKLTDLKRETAEARSTLTPAHPRVIKLQAQIDELQSALETEKAAVVESIRNEYEAARRREDLLAVGYQAQVAVLADEGTKVSRYRTLKQEVDMTRQLYDSMLQRVKEADLASALRASSIRIVDPARVPKRPYSPHLTLNAALGLFAGLLGGLGLVILRERADQSIRQPGDVPWLPHAREIAVIPSLETIAPNRRLLGMLRSNGLHRGATLDMAGPRPSHTTRHMTVAHAAQDSTIANDMFCIAVTSILFSDGAGDHPRVIVVTSASPGEGKTFITSNLARALAGAGFRVLVIDGDLRKPSMHQMFSLDLSPGLSGLLTAPPGTPASGHIFPTAVPNLELLPAGAEAPSPLLYTPQLCELLRYARANYGVVLIDSPPILQMPDARVFGKLSDAVILVIRSGQTTRDAATRACRTMFEDGTRILGTILNDWNPAHSGSYGYYYKEYSGRQRSGAGTA